MIKTDPCDTKKADAFAAAVSAANRFGLPQTVYRSADSGGWWHTNPFSRSLEKAQLEVTILPRQYFQH